MYTQRLVNVHTENVITNKTLHSNERSISGNNGKSLQYGVGNVIQRSTKRFVNFCRPASWVTSKYRTRYSENIGPIIIGLDHTI